MFFAREFLKFMIVSKIYFVVLTLICVVMMRPHLAAYVAFYHYCFRTLQFRRRAVDETNTRMRCNLSGSLLYLVPLLCAEVT